MPPPLRLARHPIQSLEPEEDNIRNPARKPSGLEKSLELRWPHLHHNRLKKKEWLWRISSVAFPEAPILIRHTALLIKVFGHATLHAGHIRRPPRCDRLLAHATKTLSLLTSC